MDAPNDYDHDYDGVGEAAVACDDSDEEPISRFIARRADAAVREERKRRAVVEKTDGNHGDAGDASSGKRPSANKEKARRDDAAVGAGVSGGDDASSSGKPSAHKKARRAQPVVVTSTSSQPSSSSSASEDGIIVVDGLRAAHFLYSGGGGGDGSAAALLPRRRVSASASSSASSSSAGDDSDNDGASVEEDSGSSDDADDDTAAAGAGASGTIINVGKAIAPAAAAAVAVAVVVVAVPRRQHDAGGPLLLLPKEAKSAVYATLMSPYVLTSQDRIARQEVRMSHALDHRLVALLSLKRGELTEKVVHDAALALMSRHLLLPGKVVQFKLNGRLTRSQGRCCWRKGGSVVIVELNKSTLREVSGQEVYQTLLHEVAHASAGSKAHHNTEWKRACYRIGGVPRRCCDRPQLTKRSRLVCDHMPEAHILAQAFRASTSWRERVGKPCTCLLGAGGARCGGSIVVIRLSKAAAAAAALQQK
jgi:predicted SprT family Zn-dependent metalloprotease